MTEPLLSVRGLERHYPITAGVLRREVGRVRAVDGIDLDVAPGETLGLVGESGCGKSTAARTILRLEEPTAGEIRFDGEDVTAYGRRELKRFRRRAQMIFQDPTSSFDPRMTIGESVAEPLRVHGMGDRDRRRRVVADLLDRVGLTPEDADRYPHELSGGQRQRVALARALSVNPDLIVADEPVSALDVSIQASILALIEEVQAAFDLAVLFISHDMGIVREICDRVAVMYVGEIVEQGPVDRIFRDPKHPYTRSLLDSIPQPDPRQRGAGTALAGDVPDPADPPPGCRFHTRCPAVIPPPGYSFEDGEWRAVMDLRVHLRDEAIRLDAVREFVGMTADDGTADDPTARDLKRAIRDEFGLPDPLSDPGADEVVDAALDRVVADDGDAALERLAAAFPTPCETDAPAIRSVDGDPVACHLHDPEIAAAPPADDD